MATLGKAAGVAGAFVAGSADLIEWLLQKARTYIFTTAAPAALAAGVMKSLSLAITSVSALIFGNPARRSNFSNASIRPTDTSTGEDFVGARWRQAILNLCLVALEMQPGCREIKVSLVPRDGARPVLRTRPGSGVFVRKAWAAIRPSGAQGANLALPGAPASRGLHGATA